MTKRNAFTAAALLAMFAGMAGCAKEMGDPLLDARRAYREAAAGPAAQYAPTELRDANEALEAATMVHEDDPANPLVQDFAYLAQRRSQLAQAVANTKLAEQEKRQAERTYLQIQSKMQSQTREDLQQARKELEEARRQQQTQRDRMTSDSQLHQTYQQLERTHQQLEMTAEQLERERQARLAAEQKAADAMQQLKSAGQVKEEQRGTVITVPGGVLFATGEWSLMPTALSRLNQVVQALTMVGERRIVIEGYADSTGPEDFNLELSQRRADTVRNYLIDRGVSAENIRAIGFGEARPIASNATAEGRALNRRVEIVIERERAAQK